MASQHGYSVRTRSLRLCCIYPFIHHQRSERNEQIQFVNTSDPAERTFLLKTMDRIKELPENSIDIESVNVIKRYMRRPKKLENVWLADFGAWYNCKTESNEQRHLKTSHPLQMIIFQRMLLMITYMTMFPICNKHLRKMNIRGITLVKRQKPRIIRSVRFNKSKDPENYCREQIMLYMLGEMKPQTF